MRMKLLGYKLSIGIALAVLAVSAQAATFSGTGSPDSDPALTGGTVETFDAGPAQDYASLTLGNVTYIGTTGDFTLGNDFIGSYNTTGVYSIYNGGDFIPNAFRFDFAAPVGAFGFNWGAADNNWLLSAYDSSDNLLETYLVPPTGPSNAGDYFGIQAPNIAYATLVEQGGGDYVFIDNFTYANAGAPPPPPAPVEPVPTMSQWAIVVLVMLLGLLGMARLRRAI